MPVLRRLIDLVFPAGQSCPICGARADAYGVCPRCREQIRDTGGFVVCPGCGRYRASSTDDSGGFCVECLKTSPLFYPARSIGPYQGLLKESIYLFKYGGYTSLAGFFGLLLARLYMDEPRFPRDPVLVPVPLSQEKLQARGFNQAELLAVQIGKILHLPVSSVLKRVVHTTSQSKLTRQARQEMIRGAFVLGQELNRPDVIVIDDILTTGSTLGECAGVLHASGANTVSALTLASGIQENINFNL